MDRKEYLKYWIGLQGYEVEILRAAYGAGPHRSDIGNPRSRARSRFRRFSDSRHGNTYFFEAKSHFAGDPNNTWMTQGANWNDGDFWGSGNARASHNSNVSYVTGIERTLEDALLMWTTRAGKSLTSQGSWRIPVDTPNSAGTFMIGIEIPPSQLARVFEIGDLRYPILELALATLVRKVRVFDSFEDSDRNLEWDPCGLVSDWVNHSLNMPSIESDGYVSHCNGAPHDLWKGVETTDAEWVTILLEMSHIWHWTTAAHQYVTLLDDFGYKVIDPIWDRLSNLLFGSDHSLFQFDSFKIEAESKGFTVSESSEVYERRMAMLLMYRLAYEWYMHCDYVETHLPHPEELNVYAMQERSLSGALVFAASEQAKFIEFVEGWFLTLTRHVWDENWWYVPVKREVLNWLYRCVLCGTALTEEELGASLAWCATCESVRRERQRCRDEAYEVRRREAAKLLEEQRRRQEEMDEDLMRYFLEVEELRKHNLTNEDVVEPPIDLESGEDLS